MDIQFCKQPLCVNQNLTNCLMWNPQDDYAYVNGRKTNVYVGLNHVYMFYDGNYTGVGGTMQGFASKDSYAQSQSGAYTPVAPSVAITNNRLKVAMPGSSAGQGIIGTAFFVQKVDLTNYNSVIFRVNSYNRVSSYTFNAGRLVISSTTDNNYTAVKYRILPDTSQGVAEYTIDCTELQGQYYIGVQLQYTNYIEITNIELE